ncbi:MAG: tyrosine-type recombinase/integrase [Gemmatimonadota bacterium]|nr:tyrosine-type recombinase/integrase [Acidimicrobiia bacterium]MDH3369491.1 tyrosine-type recombinase/integrase [Gemmatimonadota bacterium]
MTALPAGAHVEHHGPGRPASREIDWPAIAQVAPVLAATSQRYLDQLALSLRPASVVSADGILRRFAGYLTANHPEINGLVDVQRQHIEGFKRYLPTRPGKNGRPPLSEQTIRMALGTLRTFFERVSEWDYPDAPRRVLIFNGDLPTPDDPLPKFLSDVDAAKLMRAAADADPVRRLVIEMLARTGLRVGEFCALTADAVTKIKGRYWLRVPLGKLHNDRYVPLHPQLVELLDEHRASRDDDIDRLVIWNGGPMSRHQISRILKRIAKVAGIGHVHPHQLRHTLATQAINRGMSLEAIAAMLGHKTLRMTLVYARVADQTVADAYDAVSDQVDALYSKPTGLRTNGNGSAGMTGLVDEYHHTMLGNGYCNRPPQLDCQFESICESCAYYTTDKSFDPVLQAQRDHAAQRDQHHRVDLFEMLLDRNQRTYQ